MDTCIVCLADLPEKDLPRNGTDGHPINYEDLPEFLLARLPCSHILHNGCLKPWVERANSCPICRKAFNVVELVTSSTGEPLSRYYVDDKTQVFEHNDHNMLPAGASDNDRQRPGAYTPVCFICNESGYSNLLLFCDDCDSPYHAYCLGVEAASQGTWFCPPCVLERPSLASRNMRSSASLSARDRTHSRYDPWERVWMTIGGRYDSDLDRDYTASEEILDTGERQIDVWNRRIDVARRQGGVEVLHEAVPRLLERLPNFYQEPVLTEEEKSAWADLEQAEELLETTDNKSALEDHAESSAAASKKRRLSKLLTPSPRGSHDISLGAPDNENTDLNPPSPIQERKLKRPRTRRFVAPVLSEHTDAPEEPLVGQMSVDAAGDPGSPISRSKDGAHSPTFLDSLLADIDKPQPFPKSTLKFPKPTSSIRPTFLPPVSPLTPPLDTPESFPASPIMESPPNNLNDITLPHSPPYEVASPPPRQDSASPSSISLNNKREVEKLVRSALGPHYQAGEMSSDEFADINKSVSRSLYNKVGGDGRIREWDRARWQSLARAEVEKQLALLRKG